MLSLEEHDELIAEMFQELDDDLFYFYMENESLQQSEMSDASGAKNDIGDANNNEANSDTSSQTTDVNAKDNNNGVKMFDRVVQFFSRLMRQIQAKIQNGKIQDLYKQIENINTPAVSMKDYWWDVLEEAYDNFTSKERHAQTAVFNTFEQLLKSDVNIYQKFDKTKVKEYQVIYSDFKELEKDYNNSDTKNDIENAIKTSPRKEHPTNEVKNMISTIMKYQTKLLEKLQGTNNFINQQKSSLSDEDKGSQEFKWYVAAITEGLKSLNMTTSIIINAFKDILSGVSANNGNNQNNQNPQQQPQQTQQQQSQAPPPEVTTDSFYFNNDFDNIVQEGGFIRPTSSGSGYRYSPHDTTFDDKATFKKLQSLYENLFYLKRETRHMTKSECVNKLIRSFNILAEIYDVIEEDYTEPEQARKTSRLGFARKQEHQSKHRDRIDSLILEIRHNIIEVAGRGWSRDGVRRIVDKMLVVYEYEAQELDSTKHFGDRIRSTGVDKVRNKLFKMMMDSSVEVIDDELFMEGKLSTEQRKQLKDKQYGIPSLRKYPLTDETHVLQAVRFFSKAPEEYKEELARNIVKRAKELNMAWEQWDVLKPYLDESVQEATMIQCSDDREIDIPAGPDKTLTVDSKDWDMIIKEYPEVKDKTVKAGSLLYRITNRKESIGTKRKYVTLTRADALKYTDPKHGIVDNKSSAKIAVYKLKKELKIAGADAVLDILEKVYHKSEFEFDDIKHFSFLKPDSRIVSELNKQGYDGLFDPMDIVFAKTATVIFNPKDIIELDHYESLDDDDDITQEAFTDIKFKEDIPHDKHNELFDHPTWKQLQTLYDKIHNYKVGIPNSHGKVKEQSEKKIEKHYHFLSPQEFEKYKGGLSLDYNEYVRDYCEQRSIDFKQFYIITETKPTITHTLTIVPLPDLDQYALIHFGFDAFGDNTSELLAAELTVIKKDVDGSETESKLTLKRALEMEFDRLTRTMFRLKTVKKHYHQFKYSVFQYKGHPKYGATKEECMDWMSQHGQYFCDGMARDQKYQNRSYQESAVSVNELKQMTGEVYQQALQIKYGCLNEDGERITASPFKDSWKMIVDYHSQSIQSIEESKLGCCFEHAFYVGNLLKQKDLPYQVFFLNVNIQNEETPEIPITFWHQFTIVPNDADSVVLIETSLTPDKNGVFLVRDMEDAVQHLINSFNITLTDEQKESMNQDLIDVTNMEPVDGDTYLGMIDNIYKNGKAIKDEIRIGHRNEMMITFFNFMHEKQYLNEDGEKLYAQLDNFDPDTPFEIYALMSFKDHLFNEQGISFIDESGLLEPETFFDLTPKEMESKLNGFVQESYMENHHNKLKADYKYIPLTPKSVKQYAPQGSFKVGLQHVRVTKDTHGAIYIDNSDVVVGYVAIEKKANGERWITALEVSTEYQTKGFGTDLLQIAVDEFHADHLTVNRDNDRALQMYLKHGWVVSEATDKMYFMKLNNGDDTNEIN